MATAVASPKTKTKTFIVLGGSGLVGNFIVKQLLFRQEEQQQQHSTDSGREAVVEVVGLDLRMPVSPVSGVKYHSVDITDADALDSLFQQYAPIDTVFHTVSPPHGLGQKVYFNVNVDGTANVIASCKRGGAVRKLVFTSSASVVFDGSHLLNASEDLPYCSKHIDAYNESKAIAEQLVLKANDSSSLLTCALRPAGIFGPGDMQASHSLYLAAKAGRHKFQIGDNSTLFDMTYVENCAHAHLLASDRLDASSGTAGQVYNVTNDEPVFWFDFVKAIYTGLGYTPSLFYIIPVWLAYLLAYITEFLLLFINPLLTRKIEPTITVFRMRFFLTNRVYSVEKAKHLLGYKPIVPMDVAIDRTVEWLKQLDSDNAKSSSGKNIKKNA